MRFCASCDTPIGGREAFCERHKRERRNFTRSKTLPQTHLITPETLRGLEQIFAATQDLEASLGRAVSEFRHHESPPAWVDDLMLTTKDLLHLVHKHLAPAFNLQPREQEASRDRGGLS